MRWQRVAIVEDSLIPIYRQHTTHVKKHLGFLDRIEDRKGDRTENMTRQDRGEGMTKRGTGQHRAGDMTGQDMIGQGRG